MTNKQQTDEEITYSTSLFIKNFMNDHNGGTPRWLRGIFYDEKEKIKTILEYMEGIEQAMTDKQLSSREAVEKAVEQSIIDQHITMERARIVDMLMRISYEREGNGVKWVDMRYIEDIINIIKNNDKMD